MPANSHRAAVRTTRLQQKIDTLIAPSAKAWVGKAGGAPSRKLKILGTYPLRDDAKLGFIYTSEKLLSRREREKEVALEKQGEDMATGTLDLLYLTTRGRRAAAAAHRSNDPIVGDCNDRIVLPNGPEMALLAFLGMDPAVRG